MSRKIAYFWDWVFLSISPEDPLCLSLRLLSNGLMGSSLQSKVSIVLARRPEASLKVEFMSNNHARKWQSEAEVWSRDFIPTVQYTHVERSSRLTF